MDISKVSYPYVLDKIQVDADMTMVHKEYQSIVVSWTSTDVHYLHYVQIFFTLRPFVIYMKVVIHGGTQPTWMIFFQDHQRKKLYVYKSWIDDPRYPTYFHPSMCKRGFRRREKSF
jgi:hypothetical protein